MCNGQECDACYFGFFIDIAFYINADGTGTFVQQCKFWPEGREEVANITLSVCDKMYTSVSIHMYTPEAEFEYQNLNLIYRKKN